MSADLSGAELGAASPGGGRKNSARLSRSREKPRFKQAFRTVVKSGLESQIHTSESQNAHKPTGVQTDEQTHRCDVYLSNMSLVSFNSLVVTESFSVNPHAWTEEKIGFVK